MRDYEIIWKRDYDLRDLHLAKKAGGRAFVSQQEAELSADFQQAKNQGAIEVRQVVRSLMGPTRTPKMAHMEPPFVGLSRSKRDPTPDPVEVPVPAAFTQEDLIRCIQMGVSLALEGFSELLDSKLEAFQAVQAPRAPRAPRPKPARPVRTPQELGEQQGPALPEPELPLPSINFHAGKLGNSAVEEFGSAGGVTAASEKLRAMRKASQ